MRNGDWDLLLVVLIGFVILLFALAGGGR